MPSTVTIRRGRDRRMVIPGSPEAQDLGCTCTVVRSSRWEAVVNLSETCPLPVVSKCHPRGLTVGADQ